MCGSEKKGKQTNAWQKKGEKGDNGRKLRTESKAEINKGKMDGQTGIQIDRLRHWKQLEFSQGQNLTKEF